MRTALYARHCQLGAKMGAFSGWEMPLSYRGIIVEHQAVRTRVGIFDVSHMGRITLIGKEAEQLLDHLSTNRIAGKKIGTATYTVWVDERGFAIDDLIIYREAEERFFVVVNAANRQKDLDHLRRYACGREVAIIPHFEGEAILAVQGPAAEELASRYFPAVFGLSPMHFISQGSLLISATGYTGSSGFELYGPAGPLIDFWDWAIAQGVEPAGLGARDTLRQEMGYALYGHEIDETIAPTESVCRWAVKWDKGDFLGRAALVQLESSPHRREMVGVVMEEGAIARAGCTVWQQDLQMGVVTSGTYSPTLKKAIALVLCRASLQIGDEIAIQVRKKRCSAKVVNLPFV